MQQQNKIRISGRQTCACTRLERTDVGDVEGHMVSYILSEGVT
jgi:hypothetical protein